MSKLKNRSNLETTPQKSNSKIVPPESIPITQRKQQHNLISVPEKKHLVSRIPIIIHSKQQTTGLHCDIQKKNCLGNQNQNKYVDDDSDESTKSEETLLSSGDEKNSRNVMPYKNIYPRLPNKLKVDTASESNASSNGTRKRKYRNSLKEIERETVNALKEKTAISAHATSNNKSRIHSTYNDIVNNPIQVFTKSIGQQEIDNESQAIGKSNFVSDIHENAEMVQSERTEHSRHYNLRHNSFQSNKIASYVDITSGKWGKLQECEANTKDQLKGTPQTISNEIGTTILESLQNKNIIEQQNKSSLQNYDKCYNIPQNILEKGLQDISQNRTSRVDKDALPNNPLHKSKSAVRPKKSRLPSLFQSIIAKTPNTSGQSL